MFFANNLWVRLLAKNLFNFLMRQPSPTALALKLLANTPLQQHRKAVGKECLHFLFFSFHFFVGPSYYNYISTSKLGDVLSYLAIFH
jgi:hypothetical protein